MANAFSLPTEHLPPQLAAEPLTSQERAKLEALVAVHGINGAARIVGLTRAGFQSLMLGRARTGTICQFRALSVAAPRVIT